MWLPGMQVAFDKGEDDPPEACAAFVVQLASGKADMLSGRFIDVELIDDLDELVQHADEILRDDLYALRLPQLRKEPAQS